MPLLLQPIADTCILTATGGGAPQIEVENPMTGRGLSFEGPIAHTQTVPAVSTWNSCCNADRHAASITGGGLGPDKYPE